MIVYNYYIISVKKMTDDTSHPPAPKAPIQISRSVGKEFLLSPALESPSQDRSFSQASAAMDISMIHSGPIEVSPPPPIAAPPVFLPRRSNRAHAPAEAMLDSQRVIPKGTYALQTPVAVSTFVANVVEDAAAPTTVGSVSETQGPTGTAQNVDLDIEMRASPESPSLEVPLPHPEPESPDVEMDSPAPCPATLLLAKWEEAFAALDADITSNHLVALSAVGLCSRVAELRQRMMRSASILTPLRPPASPGPVLRCPIETY